MKDVKVGPMLYRTQSGWRLGARVRAADVPKGDPGKLLWNSIEDREHETAMPELKRLRDAWKVEARRRMNAPPVTPSTPGTIMADIEVYLGLPQVKRLAVFKRGERQMQIRLLATRIGAARPRLSITKQEWETLLGRLQEEGDRRKHGKRKPWAAGCFNKYLTSLKDFYTELRNPNVAEPNPVETIVYQDEPKPGPGDIDYKLVLKVLLALAPEAHTVRNKVSFENDHWARAQYKKGDSKAAIAAALGISIQGVSGLLARPALSTARETERIWHMLRAMVFVGARPIQLAKLQPDDFHPDTQSVWITESKGDNSFEKELDPWGVFALEGIRDANAWGEYSRSNARRLWYRGCRAVEMKTPYPKPYNLRHTYMTNALKTCTPEELILLSGHKNVKSVMRYTKGLHSHVARRVADGLGGTIAEKLGGAPKKQKPTGAVVAFKKADRA